MANAEEHASESRLEDTGVSIDGREGGGIESATVVSDGSWDDRPPVSLAQNDHILVCPAPFQLERDLPQRPHGVHR